MSNQNRSARIVLRNLPITRAPIGPRSLAEAELRMVAAGAGGTTSTSADTDSGSSGPNSSGKEAF
jgi:hypothetical protein